MEELSHRGTSLLLNWQKRLQESNLGTMNTATELYENLAPTGIRTYLRFRLLASDREIRDLLIAESREKGLGLSLRYPSTVNDIAGVKGMFAC